MRKSILLFASSLFAIAFIMGGCSCAETEDMIVASQTRQCHGVGVQQCMLVKSIVSQPWEFFYGNIEGFDYEPGYEYVLKVKKEKVENPPQDASSIKYTLVKMVSKEKRTSDNLPPDVGSVEQDI